MKGWEKQMDINSMDINQLKATIDRLNKQSTQVNTVRNQNIGKRKTLEAQCAELFKQYSEKYGVELTQETLQGEIQRVTAEKEFVVPDNIEDFDIRNYV